MVKSEPILIFVYLDDKGIYPGSTERSQSK